MKKERYSTRMTIDNLIWERMKTYMFFKKKVGRGYRISYRGDKEK